MNRPIKFRAYDKKLKLMTYFGESGEDILYFENGIYWTRNHDGDGYDVKDFVLMQFTGLTDKNGVEIYEGDIVKIAGEEIIKNGIDKFVVEYNTPTIKPFDVYKTVEIIGNVYEHPELLK